MQKAAYSSQKALDSSKGGLFHKPETLYEHENISRTEIIIHVPLMNNEIPMAEAVWCFRAISRQEGHRFIGVVSRCSQENLPYVKFGSKHRLESKVYEMSKFEFKFSNREGTRPEGRPKVHLFNPHHWVLKRIISLILLSRLAEKLSPRGRDPAYLWCIAPICGCA